MRTAFQGGRGKEIKLTNKKIDYYEIGMVVIVCF